MEENELVKEITPEEVKNIDPFEISYIAMKDGSIIMVNEKNVSIKNKDNNYQIKEIREKEEQKSPNFNLSGKKYISHIKSKIDKEQEQYEEEGDFNVYYSNNNKKSNKKIFRDKSYQININNNINDNNLLYEENISHIKKDSFYSPEEIKPIYRIEKIIHPNKNTKIEYIYDNNNIENKKEFLKNNNKIINNSSICYNNKGYNDLENKKPFYVVKKKYKYYKKTTHENPIRESRTFNSKMPYKKHNNLYIQDNNSNISIIQSKYSINANNSNDNVFINDNNNDYDNENDNYIPQYYRTPEQKRSRRNMINYSYTTDIDRRDIIRERKLDKVITKNTVDNYNNYEILNKSKYIKTDRNAINTNNYRKAGYSMEKNQKNSFVIMPEELKLDEEKETLRAKTPLLSMKNLRRNNYSKKINYMKNNNKELIKCLTKDNHKYYERKDFNLQKKSISKYITKKDSKGKIIHIFENK